jgi:hypothetical protein
MDESLFDLELVTMYRYLQKLDVYFIYTTFMQISSHKQSAGKGGNEGSSLDTRGLLPLFI